MTGYWPSIPRRHTRTLADSVCGASVRVGSAQALPFDDGGFDAVLSQLVIQALDDAPAAAREMRRIAAVRGVVAARVWDFRGGMPLLDAYWAAARALAPDGARDAGDDSVNPWCTRDGLRRLWEEAGIAQVETAELSAGAGYDGFDDAWFSFAAGAGFSGAYCRSLDDLGARLCAKSSAVASPSPTTPSVSKLARGPCVATYDRALRDRPDARHLNPARNAKHVGLGRIQGRDAEREALALLDDEPGRLDQPIRLARKVAAAG
jgi:SAM-dependent methyltransferase